MLTYEQATGVLRRGLDVLGTGYAGAGPHKNNPASQHLKNLGPLPRGKYTIVGPPYDTKDHGPYVLRLRQDPSNQMFGRDGFLIHGDNGKGTASQGCICVSRAVRVAVWESGDRELEVV